MNFHLLSFFEQIRHRFEQMDRFDYSNWSVRIQIRSCVGRVSWSNIQNRRRSSTGFVWPQGRHMALNWPKSERKLCSGENLHFQRCNSRNRFGKCDRLWFSAENWTVRCEGARIFHGMFGSDYNSGSRFNLIEFSILISISYYWFTSSTSTPTEFPTRSMEFSPAEPIFTFKARMFTRLAAATTKPTSSIPNTTRSISRWMESSIWRLTNGAKCPDRKITVEKIMESVGSSGCHTRSEWTKFKPFADRIFLIYTYSIIFYGF